MSVGYRQAGCARSTQSGESRLQGSSAPSAGRSLSSDGYGTVSNNRSGWFRHSPQGGRTGGRRWLLGGVACETRTYSRASHTGRGALAPRGRVGPKPKTGQTKPNTFFASSSPVQADISFTPTPVDESSSVHGTEGAGGCLDAAVGDIVGIRPANSAPVHDHDSRVRGRRSLS